MILTLAVEDARPMATKYLDKWRPGFVKAHSEPVVDSMPADEASSETVDGPATTVAIVEASS